MKKFLLVMLPIVCGLVLSHPAQAQGPTVNGANLTAPPGLHYSCGIVCSPGWQPTPIGSLTPITIPSPPTPASVPAPVSAPVVTTASMPSVPNGIVGGVATQASHLAQGATDLGALPAQTKFSAAVAAGGQPQLGGLVTMIEPPEAPMGAGITIDR